MRRYKFKHGEEEWTEIEDAFMFEPRIGELIKEDGNVFKIKKVIHEPSEGIIFQIDKLD